jgi:hypothetical protein
MKTCDAAAPKQSGGQEKASKLLAKPSPHGFSNLLICGVCAHYNLREGVIPTSFYPI